MPTLIWTDKGAAHICIGNEWKPHTMDVVIPANEMENTLISAAIKNRVRADDYIFSLLFSLGCRQSHIYTRRATTAHYNALWIDLQILSHIRMYCVRVTLFRLVSRKLYVLRHNTLVIDIYNDSMKSTSSRPELANSGKRWMLSCDGAPDKELELKDSANGCEENRIFVVVSGYSGVSHYEFASDWPQT